MYPTMSVPLCVSPSVRRALGELATLLEDYHYSPHARDQIVAYTAREGTPTGSPYLDREDEADASEVFASELAPVPFDDPAWDRDTGVIFDAEMLADGTHPWPIPVTGDDDRDDDGFDAAMEQLEREDPILHSMVGNFLTPEAWAEIEADDARPSQSRPDRTTGFLSAVALIGMAAACGGSLAHEHHRPAHVEPQFTPSELDWDGYRQWSEELDRRRATADYLASFNAERDDASEVPA